MQHTILRLHWSRGAWSRGLRSHAPLLALKFQQYLRREQAHIRRCFIERRPIERARGATSNGPSSSMHAQYFSMIRAGVP